jgi:hypothetical protein
MADCAVCGRYVDDNHWGVVSNNVRGPRHYLHDECRRLLIATRDQSDRFPCPHCSHDFTPDTFPFAYTFISGGVGDGGGAWKLEDQVCPHAAIRCSPTHSRCANSAAAAPMASRLSARSSIPRSFITIRLATRPRAALRIVIPLKQLLSMIFSENRLPPIGSRPRAGFSRSRLNAPRSSPACAPARRAS